MFSFINSKIVSKKYFYGIYNTMRITPVTETNTNTYNRSGVQQIKPAFKGGITHTVNKQSCYFRRGVYVLSSKGYEDIENLFYGIFNKNDELKNMLIIGIGNSQEPFSYLATIKGILRTKPLNKNVDLYTIDLQPKPELQELKRQAFPDLRDYEKYPKFAKESFVKDDYENWLDVPKQDFKYEPIYHLLDYEKQQTKKPYDRVNDEVFEFLKNTYNNPKKSKWNSLVQEVIKYSPDNKFDVISANNVLGYIMSDADYINTYRHIIRTLKPDGYFITDPYEPENIVIYSGLMDKLKEIYNGIYQKIR